MGSGSGSGSGLLARLGPHPLALHGGGEALGGGGSGEPEVPDGCGTTGCLTSSGSLCPGGFSVWGRADLDPLRPPRLFGRVFPSRLTFVPEVPRVSDGTTLCGTVVP